MSGQPRMLGEVVAELTGTAATLQLLEALGRPDLLSRLQELTSREGWPLNEFVRQAILHFLDHGPDEVWLKAIGAASKADNPGLGLLEVILEHQLSHVAIA